MNTLKKNPLHVAVLAGLAALGAAGTAEAVNINPDGLGQALIFPYYTARAGHFTAISVINTQNNTKLVKVRFLEGRNSREVLDFNLFLSPADVWTGAVVQTAAGSKLISNDNSCVTPSDLFMETRVDSLGLGLNDFKNYQYTGLQSDTNVAAWQTLDRTREGYFEVMEMGVIDDDVVGTNGVLAGTTAATITGYALHNSAGVPANCGALDSFDAFPGNPSAIQFAALGPFVGANMLVPPRGGVTGRASIINSATGANYTLSPTALDSWSNVRQYGYAGNVSPSLSSGTSPFTSSVFTSTGVATATWNDGAEALSGSLMRNTIINEFILDAATSSLTDWVVTFPTKAAMISSSSAPFSQAPGHPFRTPNTPFANNFQNNTTNGSCDPYGFSMFNREENSGALAPGVIQPNPSPIPPGVPAAAGSQLCWEANVVPFGASSLLGSSNTDPLIAGLQATVNGATSIPAARTTPALRTPAGTTQGPNGWLSMNFTTPTQGLTPLSGSITSLSGVTVAFVPTSGPTSSGRHNGLPVVGAMLHNYRSTGVVSLYGGVVDHKFTRSINP